MPGGFVGVDIFFVISGYLIAGILWRDIETDNFSILKFYERRIRRIFPALFAMLLFSAATAYVFFMPLDFRTFSASLSATVLFASNILFWTNTDYFDQTAAIKPLLHTWSLAVEEQYYTVFPLLLFFLGRIGKRAILAVLVALTIISFAISVIQVARAPDAAFYLPFGRVWELLVGALLALGLFQVPVRAWVRETLGFSGLAMIAFCLAFYTEHTAFPGFAALLPVIGAALIIYAASGGGSRVSILLSTSPFVWIGKISYSLYLWHWPVLAFFRYLVMRDPQDLEVIACLAVMFLAAWLSLRFVETPFREGRFRQISRQQLFSVGGVMTAIAVMIGAIGFMTRGLPSRFDSETRQLSMAAYDINPLRGKCDRRSPAQVDAGSFCVEGSALASAPSFALLGDSFGDAIAPGVIKAAETLGRKGLMLTYSGCYPLLGLNQTHACREFMEASMRAIERQSSVKQVVIVARWTAAYLGSRFGERMDTGWFLTDDFTKDKSYDENKRVMERALVRTVERLKGRDVVFIYGIPEHDRNVPRAAGLYRFFYKSEYKGLPRAVNETRQKDVKTFMSRMSVAMNFRAFDVSDRLCDVQFCIAINGYTSLYYDDNHISRIGSLEITDLFEKFLSH